MGVGMIVAIGLGVAFIPQPAIGKQLKRQIAIRKKRFNSMFPPRALGQSNGSDKPIVLANLCESILIFCSTAGRWMFFGRNSPMSIFIIPFPSLRVVPCHMPTGLMAGF
jgi:hypothetical protein